MKSLLCTFTTATVLTLGGGGLIAATSLAAQAQGQSQGVYVSGIVPGLITAISGNKLTIKNMDDEIYQVIVGANAKLDREGTPIQFVDIKVGDVLGAGGWLDGRTLRADGITLGAPGAWEILSDKTVGDAAIVGETFVMGTVTATDKDRVTVKRADNVAQIIVLSPTTSFEKGAGGRLTGTTLTDIRPGAMVSIVGGLKGKTLVAEKIYLISTP